MSSFLTQQLLQPLLTDLAEQGFVLATAVGVQQLPAGVWLSPAGICDGTLLLTGHGGPLFWKKFKSSVPAAIDPVDHFSATVSEQLLQKYLPAVARRRLFPSLECPVNLMALGQAIGWHAPSPLGMGINADYGIWSAYRALWWLDAEIETAALPVAKPICSECVTQDCIQACPGNALELNKLPDLQRCADLRLQPESVCAETCVARMACPFAAEQCYTSEQMAYHYDLVRSQIHLFASKTEQDKKQGASHG
ncbi:MAG: hypothetical protein ACPG51_14510 [Thiolinea sp.]